MTGLNGGSTGADTSAPASGPTPPTQLGTVGRIAGLALRAPWPTLR
ncbi:hypothetical protein [Streptomyces sp. NPDC101165]